MKKTTRIDDGLLNKLDWFASFAVAAKLLGVTYAAKWQEISRFHLNHQYFFPFWQQSIILNHLMS